MCNGDREELFRLSTQTITHTYTAHHPQLLLQVQSWHDDTAPWSVRSESIAVLFRERNKQNGN